MNKKMINLDRIWLVTLRSPRLAILPETWKAHAGDITTPAPFHGLLLLLLLLLS